MAVFEFGSRAKEMIFLLYNDQCVREGVKGVFILYHSGAKDYRLTKLWGVRRRLEIYMHDGTTLCHNISRTS